MRTTMTTKPRKTTPKDEREADLKHTLTMSIIQKLQRMDVGQLREVYHTATRLLQERK